ncbi:MAG: enoyl-CoA hydratase/isomerase family protein [Acidimicrobiales bacterium]
MRFEELAHLSEQRGAIQRFVLPGGALSARGARELAAAADSLVEDRSVRAVVLEARGPEFCSGAGEDLDPLALGVDPAAALARLRPPVVALIAGPCRSVGLELALAADVRLAAPDAVFALDDVAAGRLPCWGGTQRLPRAVGVSLATAMLLAGRVLDAGAAFGAGLVHAVADDVGAALAAVVERVLATGPLALELAKEAVHRGDELPLRDGLRLEGELNTLLAGSADRAEGLAAFFAKRPPDFAGR